MGWDLNTIDAAPEWWLATVEQFWRVREELAEERQKKAPSSPKTPRKR